MRTRGVYTLVVMATMMLGIGSRADIPGMPAFAARHLGDVLWAVMIYFGVRAVLPRMSWEKAAGLSLGFCYAIELSQLYQAEWIQAVRSTLPGGLVLGRGFLYADLVRYGVGIAAAYILDRIASKRSIKSH